MDRLREVDGPAWLAIGTPIGGHEAPAVAVALGGLARDGLVERHPDDPWRARLPIR
jgi:hypothetical protein